MTREHAEAVTQALVEVAWRIDDVVGGAVADSGDPKLTTEIKAALLEVRRALANALVVVRAEHPEVVDRWRKSKA